MFENCVSVKNNLCGKLVSSLESIKFDENLRLRQFNFLLQALTYYVVN